MQVVVFLGLYHLLVVGYLVVSHVQAHGFNLLQTSLAVFCATNAWVCVCEVALLLCSSAVNKYHHEAEAKYGPGKLPSLFLWHDEPLSQLLSVRYWSVMWSQYCAFDPSYSDTASFGFCVDVGNGVTTLVPSVLFAAGMTWPLMPPRWLGMLGLIFFYQMAYGTCVYYFQYFFNRRYRRSTPFEVWCMVVPANSIWVICPLFGLWASAQLILTGSFDIFR